MLTKKEESLMILILEKNGIQCKQTLKEIKEKFHNDITITNFYSPNNLTLKYKEESTH